jgi:S-adenosylmethionine:tRNA ribosyltransferase-isomerase
MGVGTKSALHWPRDLALLLSRQMRTADFDFHLPPKLIAQQPTARRDGSRLLVLSRDSGRLEHRKFPDFIEFLRAGDVLVLNNSRVIPARLRGTNSKTGGAFEILLLEENAPNDWWAMLKPGKRARVGTRIQIKSTHHAARIPITATVTETNAEGHRRLRFDGVSNILDALDSIGEVPLPPYIRRAHGKRGTPVADPSHEQDRARYQTVFAQPPGSVAAPTAGLHFTPELLDAIRARGVEVHFVTLHVGLGTFAPVKTETLEAHVMHAERYEISEATAQAISAAKTEHRRIIAVGTTSVRVLESALQIVAGTGQTKIFIHPPHKFKIVDALLTNFHLPCSTLLMLVSAFVAPGETRGREMILSAYAEAIRERYRFFSYGDAMLIV